MTITKTLVIAAYIALAVVLIALNLWWVLLLIGFAALLMRSEDRATKAHTPPADMIHRELAKHPTRKEFRDRKRQLYPPEEYPQYWRQ
jgi:hypothetical protein